MESVPPCQLRMSDGLPARRTPPCQGPFTSCGCPLICPMTNDYPVKSQAGRHGIHMYVCVCMRKGFYMLRRGSLFGGFQCEGAPPARFALLLQKKKRRRRRRGVWGDTGDWERTERGVRHRSSGDTLSNTHWLWQDLFRGHETLCDPSECSRTDCFTQLMQGGVTLHWYKKICGTKMNR